MDSSRLKDANPLMGLVAANEVGAGLPPGVDKALLFRPSKDDCACAFAAADDAVTD